MGLIKAAISGVRTTFGDQWLELMVIGNQSSDVLISKGIIKTTDPNGRDMSSNHKGSGAITDGTRVSVPEGYAFLVVENGGIKDIVTESGEYTWSTGTEPSFFKNEGIGKGIKDAIKQIGERIRFGGQFANEQMGVYIRLTEIMNNKFGTPSKIPYNDIRYGNIYIRSYGQYSFKIDNPVLLIANVTGLNFANSVTVKDIFNEQLKAEFVMNLISTISSVGNRNNMPFDMFIAKSMEFSGTVAEELTQSWSELRGIKIVSVAIESIEPDDESKEYIRELDKAMKIGSIPGYATMKQLDAMNKLAENEGAGTPNLFMGMGLGQVFGQNMANMGQMNNVQMPVNNSEVQQYNNFDTNNNASATIHNAKFCSECGHKLTGGEKFCPECGKRII